MRLRILLSSLALAGCAVEPDLDTDAPAVLVGDTDFACGGGLLHLRDVRDGGGHEETIAIQFVTVAPGESKLVDSWLVGKQVNTDGDDDILQALRLHCDGPVHERTQTTQNALRNGPILTTHARLALETPGVYVCMMSAYTEHVGARLDVYGDQSCIATSPTPATDWPRTTDDEDHIGEGRLVAKGSPVRVMVHTFALPADTTSVELEGDLELTDINGPASGTTIVGCTIPDRNDHSALARVRMEAVQLATSGNCGSLVAGPNLDVEIDVGTHHRKLFPALTMPISHAPGCLPQVYVRGIVQARDGGNDLCFHAARYSNVLAYPHADVMRAAP